MPYRLFVIALAATLAVFFVSSPVLAGGGPEGVCLVVNPKSPGSVAIANHYMQLRHIPPCNVVYVPWDPNANSTDIKQFRERILKPVLETLEQRRLAGQIDCIVYSSDFPWLIDFNAEIQAFLDELPDAQKPKGQSLQIIGKQASLTGLTYLYQYILSKTPGYVSLDANRYMRPVVGHQQTAPTMGFRGAFQFDKSGKLVPSGGQRYLLSAVLAVTSNPKRRGTTVEEAMAYLSRSAKVDGTHPKGAVYFTYDNKEIRTTKRSVGFPAAQEALDKLGIPNELIGTSMPISKKDILGLTCGVADFSWDRTNSTILPGAICDNLTSWGCDMRVNAKQTPVIEFLRNGAAGVCGTVIEPYLILAKFPTPMLHAHYARGCSLAEAFYQSIRGPYQQLIVGDALCQPFARIPKVTIPGLKPGQKIRGNLSLRPKAELPPKPKGSKNKPSDEAAIEKEASKERISHFELFVDGVRQGVAKPGDPLELDTTKLADGYHEFRVVVIGPAPILTQGRSIAWIIVDNHGHTIQATAKPAPKVPFGQDIVVTAESPGAKEIEVRHNGRVLKTIQGASGNATIPSDKLGAGLVYLQVVGVFGDQPEEAAFARPIVLWIEPPPMPSQPKPKKNGISTAR